MRDIAHREADLNRRLIREFSALNRVAIRPSLNGDPIRRARHVFVDKSAKFQHSLVCPAEARKERFEVNLRGVHRCRVSQITYPGFASTSIRYPTPRTARIEGPPAASPS